jgi:crotonobetainyl-CoA:carnitine CoA-transferase CaiB-like acyl-CoA transferase
MERLSRFGVPCGAVLDTREVLANEQLRATGMVVHHVDPQWGELFVPGCPIRIDAERPRLDPAPALGEHTAEVLAEARKVRA